MEVPVKCDFGVPHVAMLHADLHTCHSELGDVGITRGRFTRRARLERKLGSHSFLYWPMNVEPTPTRLNFRKKKVWMREGSVHEGACIPIQLDAACPDFGPFP